MGGVGRRRGRRRRGAGCRAGRDVAVGRRLKNGRGLLLLEDWIVAQTLALGFLAIVARGMCFVALELGPPGCTLALRACES